MKNIKLFCLLSLVGLIILSGCATKGGEASTQNDQNAKQEMPRIVGDIPAGSPFSKIDIGMPMGQVNDIIGSPSDQSSYATGKAFIPFYYGSDTARIEAYYKGQGRITFTGGSGFGGKSYKVYRIIYDPNENGYNEK
ncbi:MAG: hypothetical protein V3U88_10730 [Methylococcales bacterium]